MKEEWKSLDFMGYPNYEVSNMGGVRSLNYARLGEVKELNKLRDKHGYVHVNLSNCGKRKKFAIHRLVGMAFIQNPNNLPMINHMDENKHNNCVSNLEWCDAKYNTNYGTAIDRSIDKRANKIYQYSLDGQYIKEWRCIGDISDSMPDHKNCSRNIHKCCELKRNKAYGYMWSYEKHDSIQFTNNECVDFNRYIYYYNENYRYKGAIHGLQSLSMKLGINKTCIGDCLRGFRKSAKGYIFSFEKYSKEQIKEMRNCIKL